jgi:hypothetical protein
MLERFPVWLLSLAVAVFVAASVQVGIRVAQHLARRRPEQEPGGDGIGAVVGAMLGLLAFMLAIAFGMAADRRTSRKELLLAEVNAIGTAWLRADLIPEPHRTASRELLREYVNLRLDAAEHPERLLANLEQATALHGRLWTHAAALADADLKNPDIVSLYVEALNETIDLQTSRVTVARYRIPPAVWLTFAILASLSSLAVGLNFGRNSNRSHLMTAMLSVSLGVVMFLIFDLDRGNQGWLKVDQEPMYQLRDGLAAP